MINELDNARRIHLIGVGGCSMSGIAQILAAQGHIVSGSDREKSQFTDKLERLGIPVMIGQKADQVEGSEAVVYSAAIKPDNPERVRARELGLPEIERSVALGEISKRFHNVAAIAGCHGKTTITSMLAYIDAESNLGATLHIGGYVDLLDGGVKVGANDILITEACEYVRSFLTLSPTIALINNIDNDHLDFYKDIDEIISTFAHFCSLIPKDGHILVCTDDVNVNKMLKLIDRPITTYGISEGDYHTSDVSFDEKGCASFMAYERNYALGRIHLNVPGTHNIINALAATAVARTLNVEFKFIQKAILKFENTKRRFEFMGTRDGVDVYHDYGHHPHEIEATLEAASRVPHKSLYCVFQCNSYTRAKTLFCENVTCFKNADMVLVPDIYPGRETDTGIVHAKDMVNGINAQTNNAVYLENFEKIRDWLTEHAVPGDMVVTVGSGNVYAQTKKLL